ncbi:MAG TPA: hypothetical protein VEP30_13995 [Chthoniobacterales bacterium]|nr:hypothetical protein [Chthoniobacterales bacterium]
MAALIFLGIGLLCILIGRILLIGAAFGVSVWWGLGIFLPFGPLLFRLNYPDLAPLSRTFRLVALPCILAYFVMRPGPPNYDKFFKHKSDKPVASAPANHYGLEKVSKVVAPPTVEQRRAINATELERLTAWSQTLRLKKRDLLHSDVQGNLAYNAEVAEYNAALAKATAEKSAIWPQKK